MRTIDEPGVQELFEKCSGVLHPRLIAKLEVGWEGIMRRALLALMPARELGKAMSDDLGRPSKELYSMAGLIFLAESFDWTHEEATRRYACDAGVQYALNLPHYNQYLCERTYEQRLREFRRSDLACQVFADVTARLITDLGIEVNKQRLDSTHVFSHMARFGRTKLLAETMRRFLDKLERCFPGQYGAVDRDILGRYEKSDAQLFGRGRKRLVGEALGRLRRQMAEDMHRLIALFENDAAIVALRVYATMLRVFTEQCELVDGTPMPVPKTGSRCLQNPSDPDATYDGHKGPGYQAQLAQTFGAANAVNLITAVLAETAADQDTDALIPMVEQLERAGLAPELLVADTAYGSDENVQAARDHGVTLVAPVAGTRSHPSDTGGDNAPIHALDFARDERTGAVLHCPTGNKPLATGTDGEGRHSALFDARHCARCPRRSLCPAATGGTKCRVDYTDKGLRLEARRRQEETRAFTELYRWRAGIEGAISVLKRRWGLGRLSVRGKSAVATAIYLKAAAYNMTQAAKALKKGGKGPQGALPTAVSVLLHVYRRLSGLRIEHLWHHDARRTPTGMSCPLAA